MGSATPLHVVVFPFMAQGHTLPMLDLSKLLACRGLKVTIITTPANFPGIHSKVSKNPEISISVIPFPRVEGPLEGVENTVDLPSEDLRAPFIEVIKKLKEPFEEILRGMFEAGCPPIGVISDFFLGWTLDSCNSFGIPRIVTYGMSALSQAILIISGFHTPYILASLPEDPVQFPELPTPFQVTRADFLHLKHDPRGSLMSSIIQEFTEADLKSWGLLVNSFEDIEREHIAALESLYSTEAKAWCVGPLLLCNPIKEKEEDANEPQAGNQTSDPCIEWLNKQIGYETVLYISFGSEAHVSDEQLDEIALGLEMAMHPFIWVVKSRNWVAPEGWEERVKERGLIVRGWVEQCRILAHPKTGGFLSHCGWNSVLEGLSMGVPLLAWPMAAEQPFNAKIVADWLGAGIRILELSECSQTIGSEIICDKIKELMEGEKGRKARARAQEVKRMARQAMKKGGSSDRNLNELIESLARRRKHIT
ncbi:hypothetical protein VitviT2T_014297 [Vitis vinifera]|uniref:Glycosyltransferase n=2 Tax=Vitis vinifera TaxID=29760 RepID=A0ABY9CLY3_VITVI|nr:probable UDP-glucosyl transferase 73B6 [Vitis vinifera]WJZ95531.1 hypothetical protein VitviT2T_014297 [Vitis vinifera]|eukprot:XP_010655153.1 PREDICTED: scopoletin glucosyltransferase [Vitis vinifera]